MRFAHLGQAGDKLPTLRLARDLALALGLRVSRIWRSRAAGPMRRPDGWPGVVPVQDYWVCVVVDRKLPAGVGYPGGGRWLLPGLYE